MRPAAATMLSAAVLAAPGCGSGAAEEPVGAEEVRRAAYRSLAARARLESCAAADVRAQADYEDRRLEELRRLAAEKQAGRAFWRGANEWNAVARAAEPPACPAGEGPARLAAYSRRLDALAGAIAGYRE